MHQKIMTFVLNLPSSESGISNSPEQGLILGNVEKLALMFESCFSMKYNQQVIVDVLRESKHLFSSRLNVSEKLYDIILTAIEQNKLE